MASTEPQPRAWQAPTLVPLVILLAATALYVAIGLKYALDPAGANPAIALRDAVGRTDLRAGLGGFPLGVAATLAFCLLTRRTSAGLALALGVTAAVLAVRLIGAGRDDTVLASARLLAAESAVVALSAIGLALGRRRSA
jgi:hypothetical protein